MTGGSHIIAIGSGENKPEAPGNVAETREVDETSPAFTPDEGSEPDDLENGYEIDNTAESGTPPWLAPALAILGVAVWSGFYAWANIDALSSGMSPADWTTHIGAWALPTLLIAVLWLIAMRSSVREARRFGDAANQLSAEAANLEQRLITVNRELSLAREFLASETRDLEALGRLAGERLSSHADRLGELVEANQSRVEAIGKVSEAALENMEKLRGQLPVIASSAKDVTNNIGNAGRTAHGQLEEMVKGFKRINDFGQACEKQVVHLRGIVDETIEELSQHSEMMEGRAAARFAELNEREAELQLQLERNEIEALATIRQRALALSEELAQARQELDAGEQACFSSLKEQLALLRSEGGSISSSLREGTEQTMDDWRSAFSQFGEERIALFTDMETSAENAITAVRDRFAGVAREIAEMETEIAERGRKLDAETGRRRGAAYKAEEQAIARFDELLEKLDARLTERATKHEQHGDRLAAHAERLTGRLNDYDDRLSDITEKAIDSENRIAGSLGVLASRLSDAGKSLAHTATDLDSLTEKSVRLLELLQASSQQSEERLPGAIGEAHEGLEGLQNQIETLLGRLGKAGEHGNRLATHIAQSSDSLGSLISDVSQALTSIDQTGTAQEEQLSNLIARLDEIEKRNEALSHKTQDELREAIEALNASAEAAAATIGDKGAENVSALAQRLGEESAEAIDRAMRARAAETSGQLEQAAAHAAGVSREATIQLRDQLAKVNELIGNLERRIEHARERAEEQVDHDFARRVALITESLNSNAIDIAKALATDVSDTAWAGYLRGDRGIFTRRAVSLLDANEAKAIQQVFERDPDFREHVSRYIHDFEAILREVLSTRDGNALAVTLLSSDMGKLYVALAQAIERLRN